jgi:hypothetical protein
MSLEEKSQKMKEEDIKLKVKVRLQKLQLLTKDQRMAQLPPLPQLASDLLKFQPIK